jgi:hypothetical protein
MKMATTGHDEARPNILRASSKLSWRISAQLSVKGPMVVGTVSSKAEAVSMKRGCDGAGHFASYLAQLISQECNAPIAVSPAQQERLVRRYCSATADKVTVLGPVREFSFYV